MKKHAFIISALIAAIITFCFAWAVNTYGSNIGTKEGIIYYLLLCYIGCTFCIRRIILKDM